MTVSTMLYLSIKSFRTCQYRLLLGPIGAEPRSEEVNEAERTPLNSMRRGMLEEHVRHQYVLQDGLS